MSFPYADLAATIRAMLDNPHGLGRILVVEDEVLLQMLAADMLEEVGLKAEVAGSGTEALNKLKLLSGAFDAAIVDIGLPDRKGEGLISEIRALYPSLPIVVASGQNEATLRERFAGDGAIDFLAKPYDRDGMIRALRRLGLSIRQD